MTRRHLFAFTFFLILLVLIWQLGVILSPFFHPIASRPSLRNAEIPIPCHHVSNYCSTKLPQRVHRVRSPRKIGESVYARHASPSRGRCSVFGRTDTIFPQPLLLHSPRGIILSSARRFPGSVADVRRGANHRCAAEMSALIVNSESWRRRRPHRVQAERFGSVMRRASNGEKAFDERACSAASLAASAF